MMNKLYSGVFCLLLQIILFLISTLHQNIIEGRIWLNVVATTALIDICKHGGIKKACGLI